MAMEEDTVRNVRTSYDPIADEYARRIYDELKDKPLDREILDRFATRVRYLGPVRNVARAYIFVRSSGAIAR